ncbi:MAG: peptidoglycan bridge formation glycyltransferase FemA/FemB family protein, partial [Candidatus Delongbacteria bacterium]|nr:peptidoglycan bridge formation glycyltransferase FemA/FemB family protein [Candidatus Delongbacteria bacterium]
MNLDVKPKSVKKLLKTPLVQQTSFWSEVKKNQGLVSTAFDIKAQHSDIFSSRDSKILIHDDIHILIQSAARDATIAYVPYGPFIEPSEEYQGAFLEELSECLRPHLPDNCMMIRYDLHWQSHWAKEKSHFDENGIWKGVPEKRNQEFRFNFNTKEWNLRKANTDVLPSSTIFLDIHEQENDLLGRMKPKTRYNIRLAERKGVRVRKAGIGEIGTWYDLYRQTCQRNGIFL